MLLTERDATSTPFRDAGQAVHRFPISPAPGAAAVEQATFYRVQDAGNGFSVAVRNTGDAPFTFSLAESNDAGASDAYSTLTVRLGTGTATTVTLQPGGYAEVEVDYSATYKPYLALFTDSGSTRTAVGYADLMYRNGSFDRTAKPTATDVFDDTTPNGSL